MPIKPENKARYPANWKEISKDIRFNRAENKCERCGAINHQPHPETGSKVILTVAHLDHQPENCDYSNLMAMCQKCHNNYDKQHRKKTIRKYEQYLIDVGIRASDHGHVITDDERELLKNNIEYFKKCYTNGLSAYKALLSFHDYLNGKFDF
jgi:hypothetical protein